MTGLDTLQLVREVARVDERLAALRNQLERIPARIAQIDQAEGGLKRGEEAAHAKLEEARQTRRKAEKEIESLREQVSKYLRQQIQVKTNKEYQAILHEIETLNGKIDEWETRVLEQLDAEDQARREMERVRAEIGRTAAEHAAERSRLLGLRTEKLSEVEGLESDREGLLARLPEEEREQYEFLNGRFPGSAAVPIEGEHCSGCQWHLVPHTRQAVRAAQGLVQCEHCRRFLFLP